MSTATFRRASGCRDLLDTVGGDPFVRYEVAEPDITAAWLLGRSAVLFRRSHSGRSGVAGVGDPAEIAVLLHELDARSELAGLQSVTVPRTALPGVAAVLPLGAAGGDWDWLWTDTPPARQPAEVTLSTLDDTADADELIALNTLGNPTAESEPGSGRTELWLGARDRAGRIVAAGALHRTAAGAPHLTGIVTHPDHRGVGYGAAVVAGLTRAALQLPGPVTGVSTLGMYSGNDGARRIYHRLGYRTAQQFASRPLLPH